MTMANNAEEKNSTKIILHRNYRNEYLFSEIYLRDITQRPVTDENLRTSLQTIKEWREYADNTSLEKWTTTYIEPVLDTLGFGHHREEEGMSNVLLLFPDVDRTKLMSICYAVSLGEDINCTIKGKHWAEKIMRNLRKHSFEWGILTDGIYWRIYHTKESTPYETYVEVNLESILKNQDYPAFQIFYFFFRPDNFIKKENGECKFDNYKEESVKTTEYIEENLRTAIEREEEGGQGVLQTLCLGYLDALRKERHSEEERLRVYGGAILYLFRLLFLFYSTARDLLKSESIEAFKSIVLDSFRFHNEGGAQSNSYDLWLRLQNLFAEIDLTYNGGLFNPHESNLTQFIEETRITDPFLSEVVFGLGYYHKSKGNFVPIEYRDLSVRHLGSLYEGLLEHNLFIATENTVVRKSGAKVRFIPQSQAGRISRSETIIEKGKVYFSEDAKERKLTGSYYTPEDVVEYIVKNTVDALLGEKKQELMANVEPIINEINSAINESERRRLELFIEDKVIKFIEQKILSLSVLDPTMGSGHFLVNTTNHIANFIVEILNEYPGDDSNVDSNPAFWRRRVVEGCIYGVDLNPLAVELAKLCLWITTAFKEKPLPFLNHHLKQGNALVGVRILDLKEHLKKSKKGYYDLFMQSYISSINQAAQSYREELSKLTEAREDIDEKKEILEGLDKKLSPHKQLCNLFTHYLLGEVADSNLLSHLENWGKPDKLQKSSASLNSKDFFQWDIEFPNVFYGDNPGFDCVIGNPPYVDIPLNNIYTPFIKDTREGTNLYIYLAESVIMKLKDAGYFSFILPLAAFCTDRMITFQKFLKDNSMELFIANFAVRPDQIFKDAGQRVSMFKCKKGNTNCSVFTSSYIRWKSEERPRLFNNIKYVKNDFEDFPGSIPKIGSYIETQILNKIYKNKKRISDYIDLTSDNKVYYGYGVRYWVKCMNFLGEFENSQGKKGSTGDRELSLNKVIDDRIIVCLLNSSLFYWYFILFSDCRNLTKRIIYLFPFEYELLTQKNYQRLISLCNELMDSYLENSLQKICNYKTTGKITYREFYPRKSKHIIDKIDNIFAKHYQLTTQESNFILHYHEVFRIDQDDKGRES